MPRWVTFGEIAPEMREPDTYVLVAMTWVGILGLAALLARWIFQPSIQPIEREGRDSNSRGDNTTGLAGLRLTRLGYPHKRRRAQTPPR